MPPLAGSDTAEADGDRLNDGFRSFVEIEAQLHSLAENNSDIAVLYDLGERYPNGDGSTKTSWEGRHFWAMKISDNPLEDEPEEPDILYVSLHHSREWMTTEMMMWLIEHLLGEYGTNDTITQIVDTREIWCFPVLNPDGFVYSETGDRTWRKNRRDNGDGTFGVDPNRNYGFAWGYDNQGSSPQTNQETYRGPYPFSEPCTQIMRDLAYDIGFELGISFHTYQEVMTWAPAYIRAHMDRYPIAKELARRMAAHNGYEYGDILDGILYPVNGGWDDFMYYNTSAITFTYEMNSAAQGGFYVDSSLIVPTCTMNYEAALELAKAPVDLYQMFNGGIEATVMDPRGVPIEDAQVHVELLGDDTLNFTTGADGKFRFHAPYERWYPVTVTKEGYNGHSESHQVLWRDKMTLVNITIKDNVAPVISDVVASHDGEEGTSFGIGQEVRIDLHEASNESGLDAVVSIESFQGQYFHRRKPMTWDETTSTYYYLWATTNLKPRNDYLVTTELTDIDGNRDKDGVTAGKPDLTLTLRDITPPMTPFNLTIEAPPEGGTLVLSWEPNTDDTMAYTIQRRVGPRRDNPNEWAFLINLTKDETTFTDQGLENDVTYAYRLMAWDAVPLPSTWSEEITGIPRDLEPPGLVKGLAVKAPPEGGSLVLSWSESMDDAASYLLYRDDGSGFEPVEQFPRGTTSYVDTDVENGKSYFYKISAWDPSVNEGPLSTPVLGMPLDTTPPGLPTVAPLPELTNLSEHPVSGTAEPFASVVAMVNQEEVATFKVGDDGKFSGTIELIGGINRVSFKCFDPSLNPSGATEPMLVQVDLNRPYVTSSQPAQGQAEVKVFETASLMVSEALYEPSVVGRLEFADTGVEVPSTVTYESLTKTITLVPLNELEKGTEYRVVVDGTDPAGNHLTGGVLTFTTERPEEPEAAISDSTLLAIILVVVIAVVGALLVLRTRRRPGVPEDEQRNWEPGTPRPEEPEWGEGEGEYDPRSPEYRDTYQGPDWEEY